MIIIIIIAMEHEGESDTSCNWYPWKCLIKGLEKLEKGGRVKSWRLEETCHLDFRESPSVNAVVKNSK